MDRTIKRWELLRSSHKSSALAHGNSILELTIIGNTPSKKNGKRICRNRHTGKPFIMSSKKHEEWHSVANAYIYSNYAETPKNLPIRAYPCVIYYYFYRGSKHRFDYSNVIESINDLLVDK